MSFRAHTPVVSAMAKVVACVLAAAGVLRTSAKHQRSGQKVVQCDPAQFSEADESQVPKRDYVLLMHSTFNPPHRKHVLIGLEMTKNLKAMGHTVSRCLFVPVHDNNIWNEATMPNGFDYEIVYSMHKRSKMLTKLIDREVGTQSDHTTSYEVADYESKHKGTLMEENPVWADKLPGGYLKTVPPAQLISHLAHHGLSTNASNSQLGVIFGTHVCAGLPNWKVGMEVFAGMPSWNMQDGSVLKQADLLLVSQAEEEVRFSEDPTELLSPVKYFEARVHMPMGFDGKVVFPERTGHFINDQASGPAALYTFQAPAVVGECSSWRMRNMVVEGIKLLTSQGLTEEAAVELFSVAKELASLKVTVRTALASGGNGTTSAEIDGIIRKVEQQMKILDDCGYGVADVGDLFFAYLDTESVLKVICTRGKEHGEFVSSKSPSLSIALAAVVAAVFGLALP